MIGSLWSGAIRPGCPRPPADVRDVSGSPPPIHRADFASLDDVRKLADELLSAYDRIDVLANNAGAIVLHPVTTVDGFELTIQANHLAPFLLTDLLRDRLGRMVATASGAHRGGARRPARPQPRAGALLADARVRDEQAGEHAVRRRGRPALAVDHVGLVQPRRGAHPVRQRSRLVAWGMRKAPFLRTPEKGAETLIWLAHADPGMLVNGGYYHDHAVRRPMARATDPALASALWEASERAVGLSGTT